MYIADLRRKYAHRFFYGWWIVLGGVLVNFLNGGLLFHGFSAYVLPLQQEFGWSRAVLSGAFSMARLESGILGPLQGWLIDRYGPRPMMLLGNGLFGVGFILLSRMDSIPTFYLSFALLALGSSLGGFMPIAAALTNWFARWRATALGITMAGTGIGGMLVPTVTWSLSTYGWRTTAFMSGLLIVAVGLPASLLMRHQPEAYGHLPDGAKGLPDAARSNVPGAPGTIDTEPQFSTRQALRTSAFWLLSTSHGAALLIVGTVLLHQIPHMVESMELSEEKAAFIVSLLLLCTVLGQLLGGYIGDRVNKRLGIFACMWMHTLGIVVFTYATTATGAIVFAVLHGTAWGVRAPLINSLRADYFGRSSFAMISGFAALLVMFGMTLGPLFAGFMHDLNGDYEAAFLILGGLTALGSGAILLARKPVLPAPGPRA